MHEVYYIQCPIRNGYIYIVAQCMFISFFFYMCFLGTYCSEYFINLKMELDNFYLDFSPNLTVKLLLYC